MKSQPLKAAANLLKLKQSIFDQGEKSGKILAWRIKQLQIERTITVLKNGGDRCRPCGNKWGVFRDYYERLYSSEIDEGTLVQSPFLDSLTIPKLSDEESLNLEKVLSLEEISEAMKSMTSGKAAGPDGLPIDIYTKFEAKLKSTPFGNVY